MPLLNRISLIIYTFAGTRLNKSTIMGKNLLFIMLMLAVMLSCSSNNHANESVSEEVAAVGDDSQCHFTNIKEEKMFYYIDEQHDTLYFDNQFTAFWPEVINGKPCTELQQALLRSMTDSAELNTLEKAVNCLLDPSSYTEYDRKNLVQVKSVKQSEDKLSTSEIKVDMESMTDRLLTYHLGTYSYMAGAAHGVYANNYVTYDMKTGKAVSLNDIIADTTLLRTAIFKAIKNNYDYNKDDLFIPDNGLLPLPRDFFIDDMVLHVVYQLYEIASYAQGMIDAPIYPYLLKPEEMKRLFTPYGLELINYTE